MASNLQQEVFDKAVTLNTSEAWSVSVLAISNRLCELEVVANRNLGYGISKGDLIIRDNVTYKEALMFLKGLQWGLVLPT
jgi:hypothetical protein